MKKLFEFVNKISTLELNQKFIIKVTAGVLLLVVAFAVYLGKTKDEGGEDTIDIMSPSQTVEGMQENTLKNESVSESSILIFIDVTGAVAKPSVVKLPDGSRVFEAIDLAGGMTLNADTKYLNLAAKLIDGAQIYVPTQNEVLEQEKLGSNVPTNNSVPFISSNAPSSNSTNVNNSNVSPNSNLVNINTADSNGLQQLTGVGPSTAEKIISYRNNFGKFEKIEDLKNVSGIGDKTFDKLKDKICIN